jgi:hypothetical protein
MGIHPKTYFHQTTFSPAIRQRRISFSQRQSGKWRWEGTAARGLQATLPHAFKLWQPTFREKTTSRFPRFEQTGQNHQF